MDEGVGVDVLDGAGRGQGHSKIAAEGLAGFEHEHGAEALAGVEKRIAHRVLEPRGDAAAGKEPLKGGFDGLP